MPNILNIIGKSALCFIGIAAAGWGVDSLEKYILHLAKSPFFGILSLSFTGIVLWLLLGIAYAYALFMLLKGHKRRVLIVTINGAVNFLFYFILLIFGLYGDIMLFSYRLSNTYGMLIIILALMFNNLASASQIKTESKSKNKLVSLLSILSKSIVCFLALIILLYGYAWLYKSSGLELQFYISYLLFSIIPATYACVLYKIINRNKYRQIIMIINAAFLLSVWSLVYVYDFILPFNIVKSFLYPVCGNTAIVTFVLAFIFRSVEKHGSKENNFLKDSSPLSAQNDIAE